MGDRKGKIDDWRIQQVKDRVNILDVVGEFVDLRRKGKDWTGICPFHGDHNVGNFIVSEGKQIASCFACGWKGDAIKFLMAAHGCDFVGAVEWLADYYGVQIYDEKPVEPSEKRREQLRENIVRVKWDELPLVEFPKEMVKKSMGVPSGKPAGEAAGTEAGTEAETGVAAVQGVMVRWLRGLDWVGEERQMLEKWLKLYMVGSSDKERTYGWTIWWYIDDKLRVRTGKLMAYKTDGHRNKTANAYEDWRTGETRYYTTDFIHSMLEEERMARQGKKGWWNKESARCELCLFGLHLVDAFPDAEVCIVESEKTALIAQVISNPKEKLFMATGSKGSLTRRMLLPLIERGRRIVIYPDVDGIEEWTERAEALGYDKVKVTDRVQKLYDPELDDPKSDIADIIVRMISGKEGESVCDKAHRRLGLTKKNKALALLIEKFDCILT